MADTAENPAVRTGDGWAVANIDAIGEGPGFRKVRRALGVTAFGVNAIVLPPGIETGFHYHDRQQEMYFVHRGTIEMEFGDGSREQVTEGAFVRVDAPTPRRIHNRGEVDAVYVIVGGKDGYVGRDGQAPAGQESRVRALHELGGSQ